MMRADPDPLEEMREEIKLAESYFYAKQGLQDRHHVGDLKRWIAAWEKERAERESYGLRALKEIAGDWEKCAMKRLAEIQTLRAAVEDARIALLEGMNQRPGAAQVKVLRAVSDALDAALRGGA